MGHTSGPKPLTAAWERLQIVSDALGLDLRPAQVEQLLHYRDALLHWNRVYNLTALRDPDEALQQHLVDCLSVVPPLRRALAEAARSGLALGTGTRELLDVGSGGGLPGLIVGIAEPGWRIDCVDAVGKKVAFIRQAAAELGLSQVRAVHARIEDALRPSGSPRYAIVTSRAFASLADFVSATRGAPAPGLGVWAAMKGQRPDAEIAAVPAGIRMFHVEPLSIPGSDQQRCLVWMRASDATDRPPTNPGVK